MTDIIYILPNGERRVANAEDGISLMEAATRDGIAGILADCGGCCACATCHVYIDEDFMALVGKPGTFESELLDGAASERKPNSRLSCQITVRPEIAGVVVRVAPHQL